MRSYPTWFWCAAGIALFLSSVPYLIGWATAPSGSAYLAAHTNFDDHAVYAAWAKQAQEGRLFFENRFTTDDQPRLTLNFYFLLVGNLARVFGIPLAMHLCRIVFGLLFLQAVYRFARRMTNTESECVCAFLLAVFGAGIGWIVWRRYGHDSPIDVWQPEAFGFPSLMTNGLFCASSWLMLTVLEAILNCRTSWKPVIVGSASTLLLANIHTYDVLTIALVCVWFLVFVLGSGRFNWGWVGRAAAVGLGAAPSLIWFAYVRAHDPVFAARAATPTFSAPFAMVVFGIGFLLPLAAIGSAMSARSQKWGAWACLGAALCASFIVFFATPSETLPNIGLFALMAALSIGAMVLYKSDSLAAALCLSWCCAVFLAIQFPALFQRKLIADFGVPLGLLAGLAAGRLFERTKPLMVCAVALCSVSSLLWLRREIQMAQDNVSNTTVHSIYLDADAAAMLRYFVSKAKPGDAVLSMPGIPHPIGEDQFAEPFVSDLNPVFAGWGGVSAWCAHWSETPDYLARRKRVMRDLYSREATTESAARLLSDSKTNYVVMPTSQPFQQLGIPSSAILGPRAECVVRGENYSLYKLR